MIYKEIDIKVPYEKLGLNGENCNPKLTTYVANISPEIGRHKRPAVLILPGGGYDYCCEREGEPIAFALLAKGIQCFVLEYSVCRKPFPLNLLEVAEAVALIRKNAYEYDIDPNNISVMGFSAGGHLAASMACHWNKDFVKDTLGYVDEHKPNGSILCYPVISTTDTHEGSINNLLCDKVMDDVYDLITLDKQVNKDVPRTIIWHCQDDGCVPVSNTLRYINALSKEKIPFESHIYEWGGHGISLADRPTANNIWQIRPECQDWVGRVVRWVYANDHRTDEEYIADIENL